MSKRFEILDGKLYMPTIKKIKQIYGDRVYHQVEAMFEAMWYAYLREGKKGRISLPYWAKKINHPKAMNIALMLLSKSGWITSVSLPENNWGEACINEDKLLEYVTEEELAYIRIDKKFVKYVLDLEEEAEHNNLVRINGKLRKTGLVREGFRKSGNVKFQFDTDTMFQNHEEVIALVNKGIDKMITQYPSIKDDLASYDEVGKEVVQNYIYNTNGIYSAGQNFIDSRGRNISGMLNKIGNPIGFKIMRALLVIPEENRNVATENGLRNKYMFIAELLGYKNGNIAGKVNFGRRAYLNKTIHEDCELDDFYENVWLQRMYDEIDYVLDAQTNWKKRAAVAKYRTGKISMTEASRKIETFSGKKWYVPIEIDMSASVLGYMGLLMNHKPFMERTNMIGSKLQDAWHHDVITNRIQFKTIMRRCYGSSMPADEMWKEMNIKYTTDEVAAFETELDTGSVSVANRFKDFIINNVQPSEEMVLKVDNEAFKVECNRFYNVGEVTNKFDFYNTATNSIRRIHNTETVRKPNLKAFRRFFVTALIHNLDSQVENNTVDAVIDAYEWCIDIHDAQILDAEAADYARDVYCSGRNQEEPSLERTYNKRNEILGKYFTSIKIPKIKENEWKTDVVDFVDPYDKKFKCNRIVLK